MIGCKEDLRLVNPRTLLASAKKQLRQDEMKPNQTRPDQIRSDQIRQDNTIFFILVIRASIKLD